MDNAYVIAALISTIAELLGKNPKEAVKMFMEKLKKLTDEGGEESEIIMKVG